MIRAQVSDKELIFVKSLEETEYRAIIKTMVEALDRFTRPADITMHIENGWVIGRLNKVKLPGKEPESNLDIWQRNGWKTARGTTVRHKDDWQRLYNKLRVFEHSGASFKFELLEPEDENRHRILRAIASAMENEDFG